MTELVGFLKTLDEEKRKEEEKEQKAIKAQTYIVRGTKFLITYDDGDYLDKKALSKRFHALSPVKELYINFYLGVTRVAVWFEKQFTRKGRYPFRFEDISLITPTVENIKGKGRDAWIKVISDFKPEDKITDFFQELDRKQKLEWKQTEKRKKNKVQEKEKQMKQERLEKQREANKERRRTLNCERMQRHRKHELDKREKQKFEEEKRQFEEEKRQFEEEKQLPNEQVINKQNEM